LVVTETVANRLLPSKNSTEPLLLGAPALDELTVTPPDALVYLYPFAVSTISAR
jgi:hypothetical protein